MSLELNALWRKYMDNMADLDLQENTAQGAYNNNVKDMGEGRRRDLKALSNSMASKGMAHSGVALEQNTTLNKTYDEGQARADQERQRLLTDLARKRLIAQQDYDASRATDSLNLLTGVV